jgi:hypothetical protein
MPTEACYLVSIENAIILCLVYGILSSYFEDVTSFGFLYFAVFIGMSLSYVSIMLGFCLLLFDDTTSRQIVMLNVDNSPVQGVSKLNSAAQGARVLARSGAVCSVAVFILFVTVCVEFFTEDGASSSESLPSIALKKAATESLLTTQFAVSTALAVFFILVVMILSNSQQLIGILVRLEYMAQPITKTSTSDGLALLVRTLLIAYVIAIDSAGTFKHLPEGTIVAALVNALPTGVLSFLGGVRNSISLLVIAWVSLLCVAETFLPLFITSIFVNLLYIFQLFVSLLAIEILLDDVTLTNMACVGLLACDAFLGLYTGVYHFYLQMRTGHWFSAATNDASDNNANAAPTTSVPLGPPASTKRTEMPEHDTPEFDVNHHQINIDSLNWGIFQKKSN